MATFRATVNLSWAGQGSPGVNIWHFRSDDFVPGDESVQDYVTQLQTYYTAIKGIYAPGTVISMGSDVIADPFGTPTYEGVTGWSVTGTGTVGYAPLASAIVVGWRTTSATRSGRGRTFLSPLAGYCVDADGSPKPDVMSQVRNASTALVNWSKAAGGGAFGVYSSADGVIRDFQSSAVRDTFAVLRSRRD